MLSHRVAVIASIVAVTLACRHAQASDRYCVDNNARVLNFEMYPFVPNAQGIALTIKEAFEAGCPGLDLKIGMNTNYYSTGGQGILTANADVYEVDSVFFDDFLKIKKPKAPSQAVLGAAGPALSFAKQIATSHGTQFGIPHWMCTDFLIYNKSFPQIGTIKGPADAARVFAQLPKGLLMDLKGSSTLGELYLSILLAHYGSAREALRQIESDNLDDYAKGVLLSFVAMEPAGFGRDSGYHNRDGFYPRQFARGSSSAYVGYSEDTYQALTETAQSCLNGQCLRKVDLDVALWPFADEGAKPVAWVDMYIMDARLTGVKLRDAEALIKFLMRVTTYEAILLPSDGSSDGPPKYLLPARDDLYTDAKLLDADNAKDPAARLYPKFRKLIEGATPVTALGLNDKLHKIAGKLDQFLPPSH